jgi:hypothetical protein
MRKVLLLLFCGGYKEFYNQTTQPHEAEKKDEKFLNYSRKLYEEAINNQLLDDFTEFWKKL